MTKCEHGIVTSRGTCGTCRTECLEAIAQAAGWLIEDLKDVERLGFSTPGVYAQTKYPGILRHRLAALEALK
jgi:hypothetical protein